MRTIRRGMIGCGDVTERKSGPGFAKAAPSELVAVMRRDGAPAADDERNGKRNRASTGDPAAPAAKVMETILAVFRAQWRA